MSSVLSKLPIGSIEPEGWLIEYINRQRDGFTGQLDEISAWHRKKRMPG